MVMRWDISRRAPTVLYAITKDQWSIATKRDSLLALILPGVVHENDVEGMEMAWDIPKVSLSINISKKHPQSSRPSREMKVTRNTYPRNVSNS
jgi:hypothetical protein